MVSLASASALLAVIASAALPDPSNGFVPSAGGGKTRWPPPRVTAEPSSLGAPPSTAEAAPAPPDSPPPTAAPVDDDGRSSDEGPARWPPVGGSTEKERLLYEALGKFVDGDLGDYAFEPTSGGVNNVVYYVKKIGGDGSPSLLGVLRVYNNSNDDPKVAFEHGILERLAAFRRGLSFGIPETMPSLNGNRFEKLGGGASACLFRSIPGGLPKLTKVREIGLCAGELSSAMGRIDRSDLPEICPNFPYWDIYKVHRAVTEEAFREQLASAQFDPWRESASFVEEDLTEVMERVASYRRGGRLPWSFIHGDLHYDNILVDDDGVTGLLDFEFSSYDWRVMELAICLSKYCSEDDPYPYFERFVDGFAVHGELNSEEIESMCTLIRLRILSNVVYFVGRALSGEDQMSTLTCRIDNYCQRLRWVKNNEDAIVSLIKEKFAANNKL
jgi:homoserine kinase type II